MFVVITAIILVFHLRGWCAAIGKVDRQLLVGIFDRSPLQARDLSRATSGEHDQVDGIGDIQPS